MSQMPLTLVSESGCQHYIVQIKRVFNDDGEAIARATSERELMG